MIVRYDPFRLRSIELLPRGVMSDELIWEMIPAEHELFWPWMMAAPDGLARRIERYYPAHAEVRCVGWGRFELELTPLETFVYVSWNSRMWLLSKDRRMWLADLPANLSVKGIKFPDRPILAWDQGLAIPIDPEAQGGDVYRSSLSLEKIEAWYATIEQTDWGDDLYCLIAKKVDGRPVVHLLFGTEGKTTGEMILRDDTVNWLELASALKTIFPDGEYKTAPGKIINATYSDMRFTVTDKK